MGITDPISRMERAISSLILRGQANGEIDATKNHEALARFIVSTIQGIRVVSKGSEKKCQSERLVDIVDIAISAI